MVDTMNKKTSTNSKYPDNDKHNNQYGDDSHAILSIKKQTHTFNLDKELFTILRFFGINPFKDKLAVKIFLYLLANKCNDNPSNKNNGIRTIDIARSEHVTQASVIYHLNRFIQKGFVVKHGRYYCLRAPTLEETIYEMELDRLREIAKIKKIAKRIDDYL